MKLYVKFDKVQAMNSSCCQQRPVGDARPPPTLPIRQNGFNTRSPCGSLELEGSNLLSLTAETEQGFFSYLSLRAFTLNQT